MLNIKQNVPLALFTTFQIGGPAKYFCRVESIENLKEAIAWTKKENIPYLIIGGGSNLLISDEGFPGLVIKNELTGINLASRGPTLRAYSGNKLQELVDFTTRNGLSGLQKLTGIYGTVGGAVFGNAGAYGQTISDYLITVVALDPKNGWIIRLTKEQCGFSYRESVFKKNSHIILEAHFKLLALQGPTLQEEALELIAQRTAKFPPTLKCPGSFFKNISVEDISAESLKLIPRDKITYNKVPAAVLLDLVGAKGQRVGDIQVSESHANLIINTGEGKALDVYNLAKDLMKKVQDKFGIKLEPEVQFINLPPLS